MAATERARERHWICARRLRERRRRLGLTQVDLVARLSSRGAHTTNRVLSEMEHGRGLDIGWLPELALALDCTTTYLLGLTVHPHQWEPDPPASWVLGPELPAQSTTDGTPLA